MLATTVNQLGPRREVVGAFDALRIGDGASDKHVAVYELNDVEATSLVARAKESPELSYFHMLAITRNLRLYNVQMIMSLRFFAMLISSREKPCIM